MAGYVAKYVTKSSNPRAMSAAQISELAKKLGGLSTVLSDATAAERVKGVRGPRPAS